jgi:cytidine deaminase
MNYKFMIDTAIDVIRKRYDKRHNPLPGDTVCVICAGNGNVYTACNEYVVKEDVSENVHAEINALKKMQADNLTKIKAVTVFNSCSITPILPCNGCISYILGMNPENSHALVVTPNGNIPITEVGRYAAGPDRSQTRMSGGYYSVYTAVPETNRGASLYTAPPVNQINSMSRQAAGYRPGYMKMQTTQMAAYMSRQTAAKAGPVSMRAPVRPNQNGVNNLLKNKLNTLFEEDDAEE